MNKREVLPGTENMGMEEDFFRSDKDLDEVEGGFEFPNDVEDEVTPIFEE